MNNWFYNEVEMINKHKMLGDAGRKQQQTRHTARNGAPGFAQRFLVVLGRSLVSAGGSLLRRYEPAPGGQVLAETKQ